MKLSKEVSAAWCAALRSGAFTQGRGRLKGMHDDGVVRHCCLGVFCELNGYQVRYDEVRHAFIFRGSDGVSDAVIPEGPDAWLNEVQIMAGAHSDSSGLANLNDMGYTFESIAHLIETQLTEA